MHRPGDTDGPGPLTPLERQVLSALLSREPGLSPLAEQARAATCMGRTWSGVGFMTRFAVPGALPPAPDGAGRSLRPLLARHPALGEPVEFMLQVRDGRLATLEAFCGDGYWPEDEDAFRLVG